MEGLITSFFTDDSINRSLLPISGQMMARKIKVVMSFTGVRATTLFKTASQQLEGGSRL
ncbi:hypothetical protein [Mesorhizobium sp. M2D.F.Ca.ET.223.01.1.1]|uniref:hypothetical protein n=1 Tax=Mesorhizobium sp. M2D.F.Ca.ET.223.01.1.1 TaxID=2563940 RepID=UPI00142EACD3|nr:hypothetical protein [Mesorhizobium sp. M2D.F.Ca.ET.223.01.1.1]